MDEFNVALDDCGVASGDFKYVLLEDDQSFASFRESARCFSAGSTSRALIESLGIRHAATSTSGSRWFAHWYEGRVVDSVVSSGPWRRTPPGGEDNCSVSVELPESRNFRGTVFAPCSLYATARTTSTRAHCVDSQSR